MKTLTDKEFLAWTAGFLEGEGSFVLTRPGRHSECRYPRIAAYQVQRWPLELLQERFGGHIYVRKRSRPNQAVCSIWILDGKDACELMEKLSPLMSPRRQTQIRESLDGLVRKSPGRRDHSIKLTPESVEEIRQSKDSLRVLARKFGTSKITISRARRGLSWSKI